MWSRAEVSGPWHVYVSVDHKFCTITRLSSSADFGMISAIRAEHVRLSLERNATLKGSRCEQHSYRVQHTKSHDADAGPPPLSAIASLAQAASAGVAGLIAAFQHRLMIGHFARFSDHRLKDVGFERDWTGRSSRSRPNPACPGGRQITPPGRAAITPATRKQEAPMPKV